jgi:hypothetical protein
MDISGSGSFGSNDKVICPRGWSGSPPRQPDESHDVLRDCRFDHPDGIKGSAALAVFDWQLLRPYIVGLGCKIESAKYHCADHRIRRYSRPRTRNRYVQAHSGRLLFEGDGDDITEGQIDEFSRRPLMKVSDVLCFRSFPRGGPVLELLPGNRVRTCAQHCRLKFSAFSLADDDRHRLRTMELTSVSSIVCSGEAIIARGFDPGKALFKGLASPMKSHDQYTDAMVNIAGRRNSGGSPEHKAGRARAVCATP